MAIDVRYDTARYEAKEQHVYNVGEMLPLGSVHKSRRDWPIRSEQPR